MKIYLVGGAVRDKLLGLPVKERDWVVVGATVNDMLKLGYRQVGKEFPVFLHPKTREEYALARVEQKVKPGYKGFTFNASTDVMLEDDLKRRDLTINAMAETDAGKLIDPYDGKKDLEARTLRHVSLSFIEDPVRILRVARLLARYAHLGFRVAPETIELMRKMVALGEVNALVAERVWKEWQRALAEKNPDKFFQVLAECNALAILFPGMQSDGPGIKALNAATHLTADCPSRFAALLYAYPDATAVCSERKKAIIALSARYKVPNEYKHLAILSTSHYQEALSAPRLSAEALLHLFNSLDVFRKTDRFLKFINVCHAIAISEGHSFPHDWLIECALAAKSCEVKILISAGLAGNDLAIAIKEMRLKKIAEFIKDSAALP